MNAEAAHSRSKLLLIAVSLLLAASCAPAQKGSAQSSENNATAFDAVTIKPSDPASLGRSWGVTANTYTAKNAPLAQVILQAYLSAASSTDRLKSAPDWVINDRYDITAKVDDTTADGWKGLDRDQQMTMAAPLLRAMLEERCKLAVHTESTEISGYALVVSKHGLKLKPVPPDEPLPKNNGTIEGGGYIVFTPPGRNGERSYTFVQTTMASLSAFLRHSIIDQTGLQDKYDFVLPGIPPDASDGSDSAPPPDFAHHFDWGAVGLELKPIKISVQDVLIDHIEKPSPN